TDPVGHAEDVTIDGQAGNAERMSEHHVGGLAANARQLNELGHRAGYLAAVPFDDLRGHAEKRSRFRPEETGGLDLRLEFRGCGLRERGRIRVSLEER